MATTIIFDCEGRYAALAGARQFVRNFDLANGDVREIFNFAEKMAGDMQLDAAFVIWDWAAENLPQIISNALTGGYKGGMDLAFQAALDALQEAAKVERSAQLAR